MSDIVLPLGQGRKTSGDTLRAAPGFLETCQNAIFLPEDEDVPSQIPSRASAGSLPSTTAVKAIDFLKFDTVDKLLLLANSRLYEASAGITLGAWSEVRDANAAAFTRLGSYLRAIPDSLRRNIVWSGAEEQPLVRDRDGNWRFLSLNPLSLPITAQLIDSVAAAIQRPNAHTTPANVTIGTTTYPVTVPFTNPGNAWDNNVATYAQAEVPVGGVGAGQWTFPAFLLSVANGYPNPEGGTLYFRFGTDPTQTQFGQPRDEDYIHLVGTGTVQVSIDGGVSFATAYSGHIVAGSDVTVTYPIPYGQSMSLVQVRYAGRLQSGGDMSVFVKIKEMWVQEATATTTATVIQAGTHAYAVTEVHKRTLANGETLEVESDPTDVIFVTLNGTTHTGVRILLPAAINGPDRGIPPETLFYRVYRSVASGVYPDLGLIAEFSAYTGVFSSVTGWSYTKVTAYLDTFNPIGRDTLGAPGLKVFYVQDTVYPQTSPAPAFLDATDHQGSIVGIPLARPTYIKWSIPGFPDYYPFPQETRLRFQGKDYTGRGIVSLGNNLLIFLRNGVIRARNLQMAAALNFDLTKIEIDLLSPSEGLAASPRGYCLFHSQKGQGVVAWISDSGIWMTDGGLVSEWGMGLVKLTSHKDWRNEVDLTRLYEAQLSYDPELQVIAFDYYDTGGIRRCEYLHTSAIHWIPSGQDQTVPKITGPHTLTALSRAVGETGGRWRHWSLQDAKVLAERQGTTGDDGTPILTHIEGWWIYPRGPQGRVQVYRGFLAHGDWGAGETCDVDLLVRSDESGAVQVNAKRGLSLRGNRYTDLGYLHGAGTSLKLAIQHQGKGGPGRRYFGPVILQAEDQGEPRKD